MCRSNASRLVAVASNSATRARRARSSVQFGQSPLAAHGQTPPRVSNNRPHGTCASLIAHVLRGGTGGWGWEWDSWPELHCPGQWSEHLPRLSGELRRLALFPQVKAGAWLAELVACFVVIQP